MRAFSQGFRGLAFLLFFFPPRVNQTLYAQQTGTVIWSDGDPVFQMPYQVESLRVDSLIELSSIAATLREPDTFRVHLTGIDRIYSVNGQTDVVLEDFNRLPDAELYLLTDAFSRRVRIIRPGDGVQIGEFGDAPNTPGALERPVAGRSFLENGSRKVVVSDQGGHRVLIFDFTTQALEWDYGTGSPGQGPGELSEPSAAAPLPDSSQILICDTGNNRVLLVRYPSGDILWQWGQGTLNRPSDVEWVGDNVLITDQGNHRVIEVDRATNSIVWQFGAGVPAKSDSTLNQPSDAQPQADGTVLIADRGNQRLLQVNAQKQIVWEFLGALPNLKSVDRLADGKTLVISDNKPIRLGYASALYVSTVKDLQKNANFDSLRWVVEAPAGTDAVFQFRSANSLGDLEGATWQGPDGPATFYSASDRTINAVHDGDALFQYRIQLITTNAMLTPVVSQVEVFYHFFDTEKPGILTSPVIQDSAGQIITAWTELRTRSISPSDPAARNAISLELRILDAATQQLLWSETANNALTENVFLLSDVTLLKTVQAVQLQAVFNTNNASISPALDHWQISWNNTASAVSSLSFTLQDGSPTPYLRAPAAAEAGANPKGIIFLTLQDANLPAVQNSVDVTLQTAVSGDSETVTLELRPTGVYVLSPAFPAVIQEFVAPENGFMEMADRDTLVARYVDPTSPADVALDTAIVLQLTSGELMIEDRRGQPLEVVSIGDTLYFHIVGEKDNDFSPAQDTVRVDVFDTGIQDVETVSLLELSAGNDAVYSTGEFRSVTGLPLRRQFSLDNDGILQTQPGGEIRAEYADNTRLEVAVQVRPDTTGPVPVSIEGPFEFLMAPNPYRAFNATEFKLRICAATGVLEVEKVEIYNIAGERIRTLKASELGLDAGTRITAGTCSYSNNWWDLKTENGFMAGSGTYWAKFTGKFTDATGQTSDIDSMRKFAIIR